MVISKRLNQAVLVCIMMLISFNGVAQDFLNLDFEYGVIRDQPRKWSVEGDGEKY